MRYAKWLLAAGVVAVLLPVACQRMEEGTGPSAVRQAGKTDPPPPPVPVPNGPAPVPNGPAPVPNGPAPVPNGPAPVPNGPVPVPNGPAPIPNGPVPVPTGPSPLPTPGASPSPSGSPDPESCTGTLSLDASDTPAASTSTVTVDSTCRIAAVRVTMRYTASTVANVATVSLRRGLQGGSAVNLITASDLPTPLSGVSLGESCGNRLAFASTGAPFSTATPPYSGTFQPMSPFTPFVDQAAAATYQLSVSRPGSGTIECFRLEIDLKP
jgi:hypothetical protein